jgi:hypothetical protein
MTLATTNSFTELTRISAASKQQFAATINHSYLHD